MPKLPPQKEKDIESAILEFIERLAVPGLMFWKQPTTGYYDPRRSVYRKQVSRFCRNGCPDIMIVYHGLLFGLEVKAPKGKVTDSQKEWHQDADACGVRVNVVRSVDDAYQALVSWNIIHPFAMGHRPLKWTVNIERD